MRKTIAVIGSLDTKGNDYAFIRNEIEKRGHRALIIDTGILGEPLLEPHISSDEVAQAGGSSLEELRVIADKGKAMEVMTIGVAIVVRRLYANRKIDAAFSMGGSNGTIIGTSALRALPVGVPKVMVSTVASGDTKPYVGISDVVMIPSVLDVSGINRISARIYSNAVGAIVGMVETGIPEVESRPLITASMFGNTTTLVNRCKKIAEQKGYEMLIFHAVGTGGQTMDSINQDQFVTGVLDLTTTELADELLGGVLSAGPNRMEAAAKWGVPQIVAPGCLDMVNFWGMETVPEKYKDRLLYPWNPNITLMRTTPEENAELGKILANKVNQSKGPAAIFLPLKGISELDAEGKEFWWPEADAALFDAIRTHTREGIPVYELDCNINDDEFAKAVSEKFFEMIEEEYN